MEVPSNLSDTKFTQRLICANGLEAEKFRQWIFDPAMVFNAQQKWWADRGQRKTPHEGLDVCMYRDQAGTIHRLPAGTSIPALGDGVVVKIFEDFLGKSIFIEQTSSSEDDGSFLIFYGHTLPHHNVEVGHQVKQGDLIATIADRASQKTTVLPHLHISLGWISRPVTYDDLDWGTIGARSVVTLVNPVDFLDWNYEIINEAVP